MANEWTITFAKLKQSKRTGYSNLIYKLFIAGKRENHYIIVSKESYLFLSKEHETLCLKAVHNTQRLARCNENRQKIQPETQESAIAKCSVLCK